MSTDKSSTEEWWSTWENYRRQCKRLLRKVLNSKERSSTDPGICTFRASGAIDWLVKTGGFPGRQEAVRFGQALVDIGVIKVYSAPSSHDGTFDDSECTFYFVPTHDN